MSSAAVAGVPVQLELGRPRLQPRDGCSGPAAEGRRQIGKQADRTAPFWVDLPAFRQLQALSECPAVVTFEQGHQSLPDRVYTVLARLAEHQPTVMIVRVDCSTAPSGRFDSRTANELCTRNRSAAVPRPLAPAGLAAARNVSRPQGTSMPIIESLQRGRFTRFAGRSDDARAMRSFVQPLVLRGLGNDKDRVKEQHRFCRDAVLSARARTKAALERQQRRFQDKSGRICLRKNETLRKLGKLLTEEAVPVTERAGRGRGEWIFVAHHKSGTTVGKVLADALCAASGRRTHKYTFREQPVDTSPPGGALCHFLIKIYSEDVDMWMARLARSPHNRLVHFVRDPHEMAASGYLFHRRGSELEWTNSTQCSRDLCTLKEAYGANGTKWSADVMFGEMSAQPWLREYGCTHVAGEGELPHETYYTCLNALSAAAGLRAEARRAYPTMRAMLDLDESFRAHPRVYQLHLHGLLPAAFNSTVPRLLRWLGAANSSAPPQRAGRLLRAARRKNGRRNRTHDAHIDRLTRIGYRATFTSRTALAIRTGSKSLSGGDKRALAAWKEAGGTPFLRELLMRSSWGADRSRQRLFAPGHRKLHFERGRRGILTCSAPRLLNATLLMLSRLHRMTSGMPVEVWHVGELSRREARQVERHPGLGSGTRVYDLTSALPRDFPADEIAELRGYMCKPLAVLASTLDEVLLVDHDARFHIDPARLFSTKAFVNDGILLFRDRMRMQIPGKPVKDASRFLRQLVRRRLASPEFLRSVGGQYARQRLPWPWQPSAELLASPMLSGDSNHAIDSSVLLLGKSRAPQVIATLYTLHERYRHELYANLHGDKETYWLACELVGGLSCGVSPYAAGEMGQLKQDYGPTDPGCVVGNLMQFHPDNPKWIVHCNCKPHASWLYTHVSTPQKYVALAKSLSSSHDGYRNLAGNRFTLAIEPSPFSSEPSRLLSAPLGSSRPPLGSRRLRVDFPAEEPFDRAKLALSWNRTDSPYYDCTTTQYEPLELAMARQPETNRQLNAAMLCQLHGLRCRHPSLHVDLQGAAAASWFRVAGASVIALLACTVGALAATVVLSRGSGPAARPLLA